ncbi:MAG: hypothetical protein AAFX55_20595 [Bacteroidota bacterium]
MGHKIAFTICSNNYLPQANTLKASFLNHNDGFEFWIILVDKKSPEIDYSLFEPAKLILASEIPLYDLEGLLNRYNIIELNTSIKPSVFKYIISQNENVESVYYLDPDLYFYSALSIADDLLMSGKSVVLTPHILDPISRDDFFPDENTFLNFGIYNLGFLGLNAKHASALQILDWWEERTLNHGQIDLCRGYFVDQLWMNLVPILFKDAEVLKHYGYNMAPWNLHERKVTHIDGDKVQINGTEDLVFYHFSKLSDDDTKVSKVYNRYLLSDLKHLSTLYKNYKLLMITNNYEDYKAIKIAYEIKPVKPKMEKPSLFKKIKRKLKKVL